MKTEIKSSQQSTKLNAGKSLPVGRKSLYAALGFSASILASGLASAANVTIYDGLTPQDETITVATDQVGSLQITQEAVGVLGAADLHFEFFSNDLAHVPVPGAAFVKNYNIIEPDGSGVISDTLSITLTGHTPTSTTDANNVSVDLHFRSGSIDGGVGLPEIAPTALANASVITETLYLTQVDSGLSDLNVKFQSPSEVPVPAAAWLFGSGLLGLTGISRKRKAV